MKLESVLNMHFSVVTVLVALGLASAAAQRISFGICPDIPGKLDFELKKFEGLWYEIKKTPSYSQIDMRCRIDFFEDKGDYVSVVTKGTLFENGTRYTSRELTALLDTKFPAKFEVQFPYLTKHFYWILDTDYENYSVLYCCSNYMEQDMEFKAELVWIVSRKSTLEDAYIEKAYKILDDNDVKRDKLEPSAHDCEWTKIFLID